MSENKTLFQQGTLGALMAGLYDGTLTIRELLDHGNTGIGTMDALDGELIIIDGEAYQAKSDGSFKKLSGLEKVPYAAVTYFDAERDYEINKTMTASQVKELIEFELSSLNSFSAVKIKGHFKQIHVRNVPKQKKPYPRLIDVSKNQPEYQETEMDGTIIGFYTPALFQGAAAAGNRHRLQPVSHGRFAAAGRAAETTIATVAGGGAGRGCRCPAARAARRKAGAIIRGAR